MPAIVNLADAKITLIRTDPTTKKLLYDGSVTYRLKSDRLDFSYSTNFARAESVADAVILGAAELQRELEALALAAQNVPTGLSSP